MRCMKSLVDRIRQNSAEVARMAHQEVHDVYYKVDYEMDSMLMVGGAHYRLIFEEIENRDEE